MSIRIGNKIIASVSNKDEANKDLSNISALGQQVINNPYPRFCINSGERDSNGEPNIIEINDLSIVVKAPFVFTTASGLTYKVEENLSHTFDDWFSGTIFVELNETLNDVSLIVGGEYFIQRKAPTNPIENYTIWVNTSVFPEKSYLYLNGEWIETNRVPIGDINVGDVPQPTEPTEPEDEPTLPTEPETPNMLSITFEDGETDNEKWSSLSSISINGISYSPQTLAGTTIEAEHDGILGIEIEAKATLPTDNIFNITDSSGNIYNITSSNVNPIEPGVTPTTTYTIKFYVEESTTLRVYAEKISSVYEEGQVLLETSVGGESGTITIEQDGTYELRMVGAGGGASRVQSTPQIVLTPGGGGGSAFIGKISLLAGTYDYNVGTAGTLNTSGSNTTFGECVAYCGNTFYTDRADTGGDTPLITYNIVETTLNSAGNNSYGQASDNVSGVTYSYSYGGKSLYENYGRGQTETNFQTFNSAATDGYLYLAYVG